MTTETAALTVAPGPTFRKEINMFPYADAQSRLDFQHQRAAEMARDAANHRLARELSRGRRRRFGRWPWARSETGAAQVPVAA